MLFGRFDFTGDKALEFPHFSEQSLLPLLEEALTALGWHCCDHLCGFTGLLGGWFLSSLLLVYLSSSRCFRIFSFFLSVYLCLWIIFFKWPIVYIHLLLQLLQRHWTLNLEVALKLFHYLAPANVWKSVVRSLRSFTSFQSDTLRYSDPRRFARVLWIRRLGWRFKYNLFFFDARLIISFFFDLQLFTRFLRLDEVLITQNRIVILATRPRWWPITTVISRRATTLPRTSLARRPILILYYYCCCLLSLFNFFFDAVNPLWA